MGSPQKEKNMKFGEVLDYRDTEEAKAFIGKKGVFSNNLCLIEENPKHCDTLILKEIEGGSTYPFTGGPDDIYQFFRPILEEDKLMTQRQLAEWLANGNGEFSYETSSLTFNYWQYSKGDEDKPVGNYFRIRHWRDTEWSKPTRAIYEEDCMPNTAINKEDCEC